MTDDDYATREAAVRTLVRLDPDRAVLEIIAVLHDKRASVRCAALVGLRAVPNIDSGVLAALAAGLPDQDPSVQAAAMASLRALATRTPQLRAAVTALADHGLHSDSPQSREICIELLRQLRVPGHRQRCLIALSDPDPRVRQRAERGLRIG
jgi:HEAT repeat protein